MLEGVPAPGGTIPVEPTRQSDSLLEWGKGVGHTARTTSLPTGNYTTATPPAHTGGVALCVRPYLFGAGMATDNVRDLDKAWHLDKIRMLLHGEIEVGGDVIIGMSAYEMRCAAESTSRDFADLVLEYAQLDRSIHRGIQKDHEVRIAMLLRTRGGLDEYEIEQLLKSKRPGYALLERGAELVRRHEKGEHSKLQRVRAAKGIGDTPVCWACLKTEVKQPGEYCGCNEVRDERIKATRPTHGPFVKYDPSTAPDPATMTEAERLAEIDKLATTAGKSVTSPGRPKDAPIPGGELYRKKVVAIGDTIDDPEDVRQSDREYWAKRRRDSGGPLERW